MVGVWTSAPGKVILFGARGGKNRIVEDKKFASSGEHAVVHGTHAVAACLTNLRVYVHVEPRSDGVVRCGVVVLLRGKKCKHNKAHCCRLELKDIEEVWEGHARTLGVGEEATDESLQKPRQAQLSVVKNAVGSSASNALVAVAYLVAELGSSAGLSLTAMSGGLPIGAGLGSSAALGVACAAALLYAAGGAPAEPKVVNDWALATEVVQHGNPSGLDNAISCFGGGLVARRSADGLVLEPLEIPSGLRLLITNTLVPRRTKDLVAVVADALEWLPDAIRAVFGAIDAVALDFVQACRQHSLEAPRVARLVALNHALLRALGVSHPALEEVDAASRAANAAATKLTGAGGGGCAITLLHDARQDHMPPLDPADVRRPGAFVVVVVVRRRERAAPLIAGRATSSFAPRLRCDRESDLRIRASRMLYPPIPRRS